MTIAAVLTRLRAIDHALPPTDGAAVFNRMYLNVTEAIATGLTDATFRDPAGMEELDVGFAGLWLAAYDAAAAGRTTAKPWQPLFEARHGGRLPIQYAIGGMNTHIAHDLPVAVIDSCRRRGLEPDDVHHDFLAVNLVLARVESQIRRQFLDEIGREVDGFAGPVVHLVSSWNIDRARDVAWVTAETLWAVRRLGFLRDRYLAAVASTVGLTTRTLLTPTS